MGYASIAKLPHDRPLYLLGLIVHERPIKRTPKISFSLDSLPAHGDAAGSARPVAFRMASMSVGPCSGLVRNAFAPDAVLRSRTPASSNAVMTTVGIFLLMRLR